jgi:hypothetical protein
LRTCDREAAGLSSIERKPDPHHSQAERALVDELGLIVFRVSAVISYLLGTETSIVEPLMIVGAVTGVAEWLLRRKY